VRICQLNVESVSLYRHSFPSFKLAYTSSCTAILLVQWTDYPGQDSWGKYDNVDDFTPLSQFFVRNITQLSQIDLIAGYIEA